MEWKKDRREGSGEQEKRACFIKCVARGKSARQFSGAKAAADNARPCLKQSVTLFKLLYSLFERALTSGLIANLEESKMENRRSRVPRTRYTRDILYISRYIL